MKGVECEGDWKRDVTCANVICGSVHAMTSRFLIYFKSMQTNSRKNYDTT